MSVLTAPPAEVVENGNSAVGGDAEAGSGEQTAESDDTTRLSSAVAFVQSNWPHMISYTILAAALAYATAHWRLQRWHLAVVVVALATGYGICIELLQITTPTRSPQVVDALANTAGASLVCLLYLGATVAKAIHGQ